LLRWKDFQEKNVSIDKIIKIIEDAGFVNQLTKWVVRKVIRQISEWHKLGLNISVSLNLSGKDLNNRTLINYTKKYIERYGVNPSYIEFELTERTIIENDGKAVDILNDFKNMGLKISIDDYGTGSNSLMNMLSLPTDCIKIDKYFIHNMIQAQGIKLIEDIINLIHNLGKEVCAEGVETVEQLELLREMGCDYVQGFYFSKPVSVEEVPSLIRSINKKVENDIKNVFEDIS
jgi:EAL domain-containing protein (putative c-di-GMP-specific phosphodiesterase class I)